MKRLQALSPVDAQFWPTMHELIGEIRHHVADEEGGGWALAPGAGLVGSPAEAAAR